MGLNLAAMEKITADVQMNDLKWVEVGEGSYFKVLTVHEPTNTVAFSYKMDAARQISQVTSTLSGDGLDDSRVVWVPRVRKSVESRIHTGMFSYERLGHSHPLQ